MGKREYIGSVKVSGVSPKIDYQEDLKRLTTVGLKLKEEEVKQLIDKLNEALQKSERWIYLNVTGFRDTNQVTITYCDKEK